MHRYLIWLLRLSLLAGLGVATIARAQDLGAGRVEDALDVTDRRIEVAESLVAQSGGADSRSELDLAMQLQARARSAFGASQFALAARTTLEARMHADRAIAIVRGLPDPDRVLMQVERTAELADRAEEKLADCAEPRARALLRVGLDMQARAEAAVRESRYLAALQLTMSGRERIYKAMRLCNVTETLAEATQRALERTDEMLGQAHDLVEMGAPRDVREDLRRADAMQADAQAEFRAQHYEPAIRLTQNARMVARRIARPPGGGPPPPEGRDRPRPPRGRR